MTSGNGGNGKTLLLSISGVLIIILLGVIGFLMRGWWENLNDRIEKIEQQRCY